jgi:peptide/nickel transport system substrate-binding protein
LAGENIIIGFDTGEDNTAGQSIGPAIVAFLGEVGLQVNFRTLAGTIMTENDRAGTWEMRIGRPGQAWATPNIRCLDIAPARADFAWHRVTDQSAEGEYADFEQRMIEISQEFCLEPDFDTEFALMSELNKLHTENVYSLGLITGRYGLMLNKNLKNVPIGTPAFLYQWDFNNFLAEQLWFEEANRADQGQTEIYPNTVPFYEGCDYLNGGDVCVVGPEE